MLVRLCFILTQCFFSPIFLSSPNNLHSGFSFSITFILVVITVAEDFECLRGSLPKSGPLDFATKNTFPLFFVGEEALVGIY